MSRMLIGLLLVLACATLSAREPGKHSASGDNGACPELVTPARADAETTAAAKPAANTTKSAGRPAKPVSQRSGDAAGNQPHTPRWHSFLPGMFR